MPKKKNELLKQKDGDAILDDYALCEFLNNIEDISSSQIVSHISNLSRVIEAFIFYERVFVFSYKVDDVDTEAYYLSTNPLVLNSIINELSAEKILNFVSLTPNQLALAPQPSKLIAQVEEVELIQKESIKGFDRHNFGYYLYQQEIARYSNLPFISSDSKHARLFTNNSNAFKYSLSNKLVENINSNISKEFDQLLKINHNIKFYVPPFLAVVLEKVKRGASFGEAIIDLRSQFQPLRKLFTEYNIEFNNSSKSLKQQLTYSAKIVKEIERSAKSFSAFDKTTLTIWGDAFDFLIDSATNLTNFSPIKSVGIIPRLSLLSKEALTTLILRRRYSSIYKLKQDFYSIKQYSSLLHDATMPYIQRAKELIPEGFICITPGNPFQDVSKPRRTKRATNCA